MLSKMDNDKKPKHAVTSLLCISVETARGATRVSTETKKKEPNG